MGSRFAAAWAGAEILVQIARDSVLHLWRARPSPALVALVLFGALLFATLDLHAAKAATSGEWVRLGLAGDKVAALDVPEEKPAFIVAGTSGDQRGIFASSDGGRTWAPFNNGLGELDIDDVAVSLLDPNVVYAVSSAGKHLWRSADAGVSWHNRVLPDKCGASSVALDPADHDRVFVSGCKGVQRSQDGGVTWTATGPTATKAIPFTVMRTLPQHIYFAVSDKLYLSTDRGAYTQSRPSLVDNEAQIGLSYDVARLLGHTGDYGIVYAVTDEEGIYRSTDRGSTWVARNHQLPNQGHGLTIPAAAVDPHNGDHLIAYTIRSTDDKIEPLFPGEKGLFQSHDGGSTWTDITANFDTKIDVLTATVLPDGSGTPLIGTADGVWAWLPRAVPDGSLLSSTELAPSVFAVRGGERQHVPSLDAFTACGFSFDRVIDVPDWYLRWVYDGGEISHCAAADFDVPGGRFFTQNGGGRSQGFAVTNNDGAPFYTEFLARGGSPVLGHPVTRRYADGAYLSQAFDRYVLRWNATAHTMSLANTLDDLSAAGFDDTLLKDHGVARPTVWTQDTNKPWATILENHLTILDRVDQLKDVFLARDYLALDGLPMAVSATATKQVIRAQRTAFVWEKDVGVSVLNGADLARQVGLFSAAALTPEPRP